MKTVLYLGLGLASALSLAGMASAGAHDSPSSGDSGGRADSSSHSSGSGDHGSSGRGSGGGGGGAPSFYHAGPSLHYENGGHFSAAHSYQGSNRSFYVPPRSGFTITNSGAVQMHSSHPQIHPFYSPNDPRGRGGTQGNQTFAFGGHQAVEPGAKTLQRSSSAAAYAARGWNPHRDRVFRGRHYHWNNGAWLIVDDGFYPPDDFYGDAPVVDESKTGPTDDQDAPPTVDSAGADSVAVDVQSALADLGYYHGPIDGIMGPGTRGAITAFQKDKGLPVNGYVTKSLLDALER